MKIVGGITASLSCQVTLRVLIWKEDLYPNSQYIRITVDQIINPFDAFVVSLPIICPLGHKQGYTGTLLAHRMAVEVIGKPIVLSLKLF